MHEARTLSLDAGSAQSYDALRREVWGGRVSKGLVRTFMRRLRAKLGDDAGAPTLIRTHRGVGYSLTDGRG